MLAAQSFAAIRTKLELKARALLREGRSLDETLRQSVTQVCIVTRNSPEHGFYQRSARVRACARVS